MSVKISKGDTVEIVAGDDKGQRGEVQRVIKKRDKDGKYDPNNVYVLVAGANLMIKHQGRTGRVQTQTGRIEMEAPIHISNVMLIGSDGKPTRTHYEVSDDGEKNRVDARSGDLMPRPGA
jgi:large subunit ribosomal protein L24